MSGTQLTDVELWNAFASLLSMKLNSTCDPWQEYYPAGKYSPMDWTRYLGQFLAELGPKLGFVVSSEEYRSNGTRCDFTFFNSSGHVVVDVEHEGAPDYSLIETNKNGESIEKFWKHEFQIHCDSDRPMRMLIRYYDDKKRKMSIDEQLIKALDDCCPCTRRPAMAGKLLHIVGPNSLKLGMDYIGFSFDGQKFIRLPLPSGLARILPTARGT